MSGAAKPVEEATVMKPVEEGASSETSTTSTTAASAQKSSSRVLYGPAFNPIAAGPEDAQHYADLNSILADATARANLISFSRSALSTEPLEFVLTFQSATGAAALSLFATHRLRFSPGGFDYLNIDGTHWCNLVEAWRTASTTDHEGDLADFTQKLDAVIGEARNMIAYDLLVHFRKAMGDAGYPVV